MIEQEQFMRLVALSRLRPKDVKKYQGDFNQIIDYINQMLAFYDAKAKDTNSKSKLKKESNQPQKQKDLLNNLAREDHQAISKLHISELERLAHLDVGPKQPQRWQDSCFVVPEVIHPE